MSNNRVLIVNMSLKKLRKIDKLNERIGRMTLNQNESEALLG